MKRKKVARQGNAPEAEPPCRNLVVKVFEELPPNELKAAVCEVERRHVVVIDSEPHFTKKTRETVARKRALEIRRTLGSAGWRRERALDDFGGMDLGLDVVHALHQRWLEYLRPLVGDSAEDVQLDTCRLDWHGAEVRVSRSRNPRFVGVLGIVFALTELYVWMIDSQQKKWCVEKDGTTFDMVLDRKTLEIDGSVFFENEIKLGKKRQAKRSRRILE